jgi:hypothetical protein
MRLLGGICQPKKPVEHGQRHTVLEFVNNGEEQGQWSSTYCPKSVTTPSALEELRKANMAPIPATLKINATLRKKTRRQVCYGWVANLDAASV